MSETAPEAKSTDVASSTPSAQAALADKPAPEAKPEPPFTVDALLNCTARMTHKAWYLFYNNQKDMTFIRETPVRATLECRNAEGAEEIHALLVDAGVKEISRADKTLAFTATYEQIQKVIKHPQSFMLDTVRL